MLIDLLVILGIMSALTFISIPYIRKYQPNLKLNAAARGLTSDLRYAQQLTVTEQNVYKVVLDLDDNSYDIIKTGIATTTIKSVEFDHEVDYEQITGLANNEVIFNYYGGVSQSGQIILTNTNSNTATVEVKPSGYIKME